MRSVAAALAALSLAVSFADPAAAQTPRAGDQCEPPRTVNASQFRECRVVVTDAAELCRCRIAPDTLSVEAPGRAMPASGRPLKADGAKPTSH